MAKDQMGNLIDCLRRSMLAGGETDLTDGQLLECFISHHDEAALAALVRRPSPMVWGVCRRVLRNHHDAEDAFQATFLVLVRKAASIMPRDMVGNWLYGVAHQTARKARATTAKRQAREKQVTQMPETEAMTESDIWHDLELLLDQELSRLPDKYRVAIVLCDLEGKSRKEAARQLKIPEGTLSSRLTTARTMLAKRLTRHGLAVSSGALAAMLSQNLASGGVPTSVVSFTIKAASLLAAGRAAGVVSAKVAALTEGMVKAMFVTKMKTVAAVLLVGLTLGSIGVGIGLSTNPVAQQPVAKTEEAKSDAKDQPKQGDKVRKEEKNEKNKNAAGFGKAVDGLRIKLQLSWPKKGGKSPSHCVVVMENVRDTDMNLNLGFSLANGKSYHPTALRLLAMEGKNTTRLTYAVPRVAGRLDPFVVPLPVGSSYTLRLPLDKFVQTEGGGRIDLTAKDYRLVAELVGHPLTETNPDLQGFTLMKFWQGTVQSNEANASLSPTDSNKP